MLNTIAIQLLIQLIDNKELTSFYHPESHTTSFIYATRYYFIEIVINGDSNIYYVEELITKLESRQIDIQKLKIDRICIQ